MPRYAVVALNHTLGGFFDELWSGAALRIAADGGANRVYDRKAELGSLLPSPHYVKGDLDSIRPEVELYYQGEGLTLYKDPDQDTNDLQKCLALFQSHQPAHNFAGSPILICGGLGGVLSHTMANVESVLQYARRIDNPMYLLSEENVGIVLLEGHHTINLSNNTYCSFIPLGQTCQISHSTNLRYPLDGLELAFGKLVSTSNQSTAEQITLNIQQGPLLFLADARKS